MRSSFSTIALFTALLMLNNGCGRNDPVKYVQLEDQEIIILKDGKELASVVPDGGGSKATVQSASGDSSVSFSVSRAGSDSGFEIMHRKGTGETVFLNMKNDGTEFYLDEQFQWIEDAMHQYIRQSQKKAEQASSGQPATRSQSKSEGRDKPQPEAEGRSR